MNFILYELSIIGLFGTASQVAVYDYDGVTKDWVSLCYEVYLIGIFFDLVHI